MELPRDTMTDTDIYDYIERLKISHFRGVYMSDELPLTPLPQECGVLNFQPHNMEGSHWVAWFKNGEDRYYFDSYAGLVPHRLQIYLKTQEEIKLDQAVIKRSAITIQHDNTTECGGLCIFVLFHLTRGVPFSMILNTLQKRYEERIKLNQKNPPLIIKQNILKLKPIWSWMRTKQVALQNGKNNWQKSYLHPAPFTFHDVKYMPLM